jgi:allophanate hydrolase subunit 1
MLYGWAICERDERVSQIKGISSEKWVECHGRADRWRALLCGFSSPGFSHGETKPHYAYQGD